MILTLLVKWPSACGDSAGFPYRLRNDTQKQTQKKPLGGRLFLSSSLVGARARLSRRLVS